MRSLQRSTKHVLAAAAAVAVLGAGSLVAVNAASADETGSTLVDRIAERFSLNHDEVQVVFDEFRDEKQAEMQQKMDERLQQAVDEGKLTEEQKAAILQHREDERAFFESLKGMSEDERKEALKQHAEEVKQWAEENGIEHPFFMKRHGGKPGPGFGMHFFGKGGPDEVDAEVEEPVI
jgi:Spy/CpxP family protein refolding chaperone